jgi:hypothetical protein
MMKVRNQPKLRRVIRYHFGHRKGITHIKTYNFRIKSGICKRYIGYWILIWNEQVLPWFLFQVFFYRAEFNGGAVKINEKDITDYKWVTLEELSDYLMPAYEKAVKQFVLEFWNKYLIFTIKYCLLDFYFWACITHLVIHALQAWEKAFTLHFHN